MFTINELLAELSNCVLIKNDLDKFSFLLDSAKQEWLDQEQDSKSYVEIFLFLHTLLSFDKPAFAKILILHCGVDPYFIDSEGFTALHLAIKGYGESKNDIDRKNYDNVIRELLKREAEIRSNEGYKKPLLLFSKFKLNTAPLERIFKLPMASRQILIESIKNVIVELADIFGNDEDYSRTAFQLQHVLEVLRPDSKGEELLTEFRRAGSSYNKDQVKEKAISAAYPSSTSWSVALFMGSSLSWLRSPCLPFFSSQNNSTPIQKQEADSLLPKKDN